MKSCWAAKLRWSAGLMVIVLGAGCPSTEKPSTKRKSVHSGRSATSAATAAAAASAPATASAAVAPTSSASAAPPLAPALAAIAAGRWKDPDGGPDINLTTVSLGKCYGFKGYSMKLPEGTTTEIAYGVRGCGAKLPGSEQKHGLLVESDEIKLRPQKDELSKMLVEKTWEEPDAFLYKLEHKGKSR